MIWAIRNGEFFDILTGHNLPRIQQRQGPQPSIINEKTIADFTRVVDQIGILKRNKKRLPEV
jgi:hypothetical protein